MNATLTTFDGVEDGTDLAVVVRSGEVSHWRWVDGELTRDGHRLPPFFFSGLLRNGDVLLGNFAPPVKGEWFSRLRSDDWSFLVMEESSEKVFRCGYFRRGEFYDWREVAQEELIDRCVRTEAPAFCTREYLAMADLASSESKARVEAERHSRATREAAHYVRYARDYLVNAVDVIERERG